VDAQIVLFILLAITGGAIGIARYSIDEDDMMHQQNHTFYRFLAHFILNAAIGVVGGVLTKFTISQNLDIMLGGGIISALIGYSQMRKLLFDAITKRFQNGKTVPIEKKRDDK